MKDNVDDYVEKFLASEREAIARCDDGSGHVFKTINFKPPVRCMCGHIIEFRYCVRCMQFSPGGHPKGCK